MKALVWHGPRAMTLEEVERPKPRAHEVRLHVDAVGICGSELSGFLGENALRVPPLVMGHEFAGTVDAVGTSVTDLQPGDRVVVNPLSSCGTCARCLAGVANLCDRRALIGAHVPGAFAEAVTVPAASCTPLPTGVDAVQASLAEPLACAVRAVRLAGNVEGMRVRVIGAGPIGLFVALVARAERASHVTIHDPNRSRAALAEVWGIEAPDAPPATGDVVVDAVGRVATRSIALEALDRGGTAVFVGLHHPDTTFDANALVRDEKVVRGSFAYTPGDFAAAVEHLVLGTVPRYDDAWLSQRTLADGPAAFAELIDTQPPFAKIVLRPGRAARGASIDA